MPYSHARSHDLAQTLLARARQQAVEQREISQEKQDAVNQLTQLLFTDDFKAAFTALVETYAHIDPLKKQKFEQELATLIPSIQAVAQRQYANALTEEELREVAKALDTQAGRRFLQATMQIMPKAASATYTHLLHAVARNSTTAIARR
jgi:hypothetical protein